MNLGTLDTQTQPAPMVTVRPDGLDCYVVLDANGNALGWVARSHWHGKWRAVTARGHLSHHYTRAAALEAVS